ncbi:DUF4062 domain-containing protein [Priestia aryabhattai]
MLAWQTNSIFISSTFNDFQTERDLLRNEVFPVIEEKMKNYNHSLAPIDLRWGVDTTDFKNEIEREYHILKVCLNEIKRSRPFIIIFLGDRYGWIPPEKIMEGILSEEEFQTELDQSVTALEINYGVLETLEDVTPLFYFREPLPYFKMDENSRERYSDEYLGDKELSCKKIKKLASLKKKILENSYAVHKYSVQWDEKNRVITGLDELREKLIEDIWATLKKRLESPKLIISW